jgi:protease IV
MRKIVVRMLATIGAITLLSTLVGVLGVVFGGTQVKPGTLVEIDFSQHIGEYAPAGIAELAFPTPLVTRDLVDALRRAADDDRVVGVVGRLGGVGMGFAQIQEVRDALQALSRAGKRTVAHAETYGEFGSGTWAYYLASAFDVVYVQPSGDVSITGLIAETPFARDALKKLGVQPQLSGRRKYKTAINSLTETGYTEAHREATGAVLEGQFEQIVRGIAEGRKLEPATVRSLIDRAPLEAKTAAEVGLVDGLRYRDEVYDEFATPDGDEAPRLPVKQYLARAGRPDREGEKIALIYGVGNIHRGRSGFGIVSGDPTMGADTVTAALRAAVDDDDVRAILFRVDSPGGSYVASDTIWREVARARQQGKPVVVSMGNVAGSGGYFVAMAADRIVAQPGTITGSIGVLAGKMVTADLWKRLGVNWDELHQGRNAAMWSATRDFSPAQWAKVQTFLDNIYADFTGKVGEGRGLSAAEVERAAGGRIWTGEAAQELGLVDALGGLTMALGVIRELLAMSPDAPIDLEVFPRPRSLPELLMARLSGGDDSPTVALGDFRAGLLAIPGAAEVLGAFEAEGPLAIPHPIAYRRP